MDKVYEHMNTKALNVLVFILVFLASAFEGFVKAWPRAVARQAQSGASSPKDDSNRLTITGRIVDGLERPVSGVKVSVTTIHPGPETHTESVVMSGDDGRYSAAIARHEGSVLVNFEKDGYCYTGFIGTNRGHEDTTLPAQPEDQSLVRSPSNQRGIVASRRRASRSQFD